MIFMSKSDFSKYFHVENELLVDFKQKIVLDGKEISCYACISIADLNDGNYLQNYLYNMYDLNKVQSMLLESGNQSLLAFKTYLLVSKLKLLI